MQLISNYIHHSWFQLKTFSIMKNWWKSHLRTFDSMAEIKRISIQISNIHMWTRLFWFCWQKKLATASPEWVNLSRNSIQFPISFNAMAFLFLCLWSSSLEWYMVYISLCVYLFIFHCLVYYLSWTKHERSIISINCLKNANFLGFSFLTRACTYVVVVP